MNKKTNKIDIIKNILIIRLSSIGDIVLTTPIVRALKKSYPSSKLFFITFEHFKDTIVFNQRIDEKIFVPKHSLKHNFANYLRTHLNKLLITNFDLIIDLQNNRYSRKITSNLNKKSIFKLNKQRLHKLSLVYFKYPLIKNFSVIDNYFSCFSNSLDIKDDKLGVEFWLDYDTNYPLHQKENNERKIIVSIAPGAAHKTKQWLPEKFVKLINLLSIKFGDRIAFRLLGSNKESNIGNMIEKEVKCELQNYIAKTNLIETAQLIDNSALFITNDTGLMHIAVARKVPTVAIFGSSVKELGFAHNTENFRIIEEKMWCRPCSHIGRNQCPIYHFNCMKQIKPQRVVDACLDLLNQR